MALLLMIESTLTYPCLNVSAYLNCKSLQTRLYFALCAMRMLSRCELASNHSLRATDDTAEPGITCNKKTQKHVLSETDLI